MVLSHNKLKRKRREERVVNGESVVPDSESTPAAVAPNVTSDSSAVAADTRKKKRKEKMKKKAKKKRKVDTSGEIAVPPEASPTEAVQESKKTKKKKKNQKSNTDVLDEDATGVVQLANSIEDAASNGVSVAERVLPGASPTEAVASKAVQESKETKKKKKKREPNSDVLEDAAGVVQLANSMEGAISNGVDEAERVVPDDHGATTGEAHDPSVSVREKKGKKKKSGKDRWGEKLADESPAKENSLNVEAVNGARPQSDASSGDIYDPKKVVVGGMPYSITEDDIHDYFSECGVISVLDCMTFEDSGNFRGLAFITFTTEAAATKSLDYDGADMGGRFLKIERCKVKPQAGKQDINRGEVQKTPGSTSAYIGNLSWDIDENSIREFFKKAYSNSKIDSIRLSFDKVTGEFKGFGHIDFGDDESLEAAVKLNQTPLLGRPLKIAYAVPPRQGGNRYDESNAGRVGTCYNCGQGGHKAFLCPNKGASGSQKPDIVKVAACYSCGEEGHKSFMCPKRSAA